MPRLCTTGHRDPQHQRALEGAVHMAQHCTVGSKEAPELRPKAVQPRQGEAHPG